MRRYVLLSTFILLLSRPGFTQQKDIGFFVDGRDSSIDNYSAYKRGISFAGLLQTRYVLSLTNDVDVNGKNYDPGTTKSVNNSFQIRRARLQVRPNINDHFSANFMINFAEFSNDPQGKVLENAYIKYTLNRHFNVQAGQFRPFFGIEDALPVDIVRTLDYSNQYYAFGANGWQSFQVGLSVFGAITKEDQLPIRYYTGVYNGNNRNQPTDDDNTKNVYARIESDIVPKITIGINAAIGSLGSGTGDALGADFLGSVDLGTKWQFDLGIEYKNGSNFVGYNSSTTVPRPPLSSYRMQGFYVFPIVRYQYNHPRIRAIEFSSRYEYFDENSRLNSNPRQTIIPNLSVIFADNFYAALQAGVAIDIFKTDIPLTTQYSRNLGYLQLQVRF